MFEIEKTERINELISITKSDSGISGPELAKAHIELGQILGTYMSGIIDPSDTTIVALMRGGIFFAQGMYFQLGCRFETYDPKHQEYERPKTRKIIVVDSVINTGKSIKGMIDADTYVACNVINRQAISVFERNLYTIRVSDNSFIGSSVKKQEGKLGPDTTMRLFNQL